MGSESKKMWVMSAGLVVCLLGGGAMVSFDRASQRGRFNSLLDRADEVQRLYEGGEFAQAHEQAAPLLFDVMATEDRWLGGARRALEARVRDMFESSRRRVESRE